MRNDVIIKELAPQLLDYDAETGTVYWKVDSKRGSVKAGDRAGCLNLGYRKIKLAKRPIVEHRIVWFLHYGYLPDCQIDHIDRDRANNKISNLRLAPRNEKDNSQNTSVRSHNVSGVTGVNWFKLRNKWRARITVGQKEISLGLFIDFNDAVAARRAAELKYFTFANP